MSLTRDQWIEMWQAIKHIEIEVKNEYHPIINDQVKKIKELIQSVIGQME